MRLDIEVNIPFVEDPFPYEPQSRIVLEGSRTEDTYSKGSAVRRLFSGHQHRPMYSREFSGADRLHYTNTLQGILIINIRPTVCRRRGENTLGLLYFLVLVGNTTGELVESEPHCQQPILTKCQDLAQEERRREAYEAALS